MEKEKMELMDFVATSDYGVGAYWDSVDKSGLVIVTQNGIEVYRETADTRPETNRRVHDISRMMDLAKHQEVCNGKGL